MKWILVVLMLVGPAATGARGEKGLAPEPKPETASNEAKTAAQDGSKPRAGDESKQKKTGETVRQTPFGPVKVITPKEPVSRPVDPSIQVEEKGDEVTFRRKTPFGTHVWTKKRADLTPKEKELLDSIHASRSQPKSDQPAAADKQQSEQTPKGAAKNR